ncbi:MAG: DUF3878 family protein [Lachnospiraceae bacterium]|nr:DUF3878 family protein [Lachnospiraceae bacterium]MDY4968982.1 DUF3878 family protein [Lachnospiraceae bacterium]
MERYETEIKPPVENSDDVKTLDDLPFSDEYEKLKLLISEGQFELIFPEFTEMDSSESENCIRLVYLMNDAAESFLVFHEAVLTGEYQPDFQGELQADLKKNGERFALIVYQGEQVFTLFFQNLTLETHLFNYGKTGHFWVEGYEYLRQLEYRLAILRDKREYLGEGFCSDEEIRLSYLAEFPPLNFCCYPAVPDRYLVPSYSWWQASEEALDEMKALAEEAGDKSLMRWLTLYGRLLHFSGYGGLLHFAGFLQKAAAKWIARLLHTVRHAEAVDLLEQKLSHAAAIYPDRVFDREEEAGIQKIKEKAIRRKKELESAGKRVDLLKEEPFVYARDSVEYKIHLMIWKTEGNNRKVDVETFDQNG